MPPKLAWLAPFLALVAVLLGSPARAASAASPGSPGAQDGERFIIQFVDDLGVALPDFHVEYTFVDDRDPLGERRRAVLTRGVTDDRGRLVFLAAKTWPRSFRFALPPGPRVGHRQAPVVVDWGGAPGKATVRLQRPGTLVGKVAGPGPFNDVHLRLFPDRWRPDGLLEESIGHAFVLQPALGGRFRCEGITPGRYVAVLSRGSHEDRQTVTIESAAESTPIQFSPTGEGSWVFGVLKDPSGARLSGVPLRLWRSSKFPYNAKNEPIPERISTDRAGRFRFGPVVNGHFYIRPVSGNGPLDIPVQSSQETVRLAMVDGEDVEIDLTFPAAERFTYVNLWMNGEALPRGSGEIRSLSTDFHLPFSTDQAGLLNVSLPASDLGPFAVSVTNGRGTVSAWQTIDLSEDRVDLSEDRSSLQLTLGEGCTFLPTAPGPYELFRCSDSGPAVSAAEAEVYRPKEHPESLVRFVGLTKGRYVCVCRSSSGKTRRHDFTVSGEGTIEWTLGDSGPCPLEVRVGDVELGAEGAQLARFGLALPYSAHFPPGVYEALVGNGEILAMGNVTLQRGVVAKATLDQLRPGTATIQSVDAKAPLPSSLSVVHQQGFRFTPQRPSGPIGPPDNPNAPNVAKGLPPGSYEIRSGDRTLATFELAEGEQAVIKL